MGEGTQTEYNRDQLVQATFEGILAKASRFRAQVGENTKLPAEVANPEVGKRVAVELFLDGVIAAQKLRKDQLYDLVKRIEERESDRDWAQRYHDALDLSPRSVEEWSRKRAYPTAARKAMSKLLGLGKDKGVKSDGSEK